MITPEASHAQPDLLPTLKRLTAKPRTVYQVMWRLKAIGSRPAFVGDWTALEEEVWGYQETAEMRLKHYQKSTLSRVLEFKVEAGQL